MKNYFDFPSEVAVGMLTEEAERFLAILKNDWTDLADRFEVRSFDDGYTVIHWREVDWVGSDAREAMDYIYDLGNKKQPAVFLRIQYNDECGIDCYNWTNYEGLELAETHMENLAYIFIH